MPINDPIPAPPTLPPAPEDLPVSSQPPSIFDPNAQAFVLYIGALVPAQDESASYVFARTSQCQALAEFSQDQAQAATDNGAIQVQLAADQVTLAAAQVALAAGHASDAEQAATTAAASANFAPGITWSAGTYDAGVAVIHSDKIWIALVETSEEPGTGSDWFDYTSSIAAGEVVANNADTTAARLTNVSWLTHRGIGAAHDADTRTLTNPQDLHGLGFISGRVDGDSIGVPGASEGDIGAFTIEANGAASGNANAVTLTFKRNGQMWIRSSVNSTTWGDWVRVRGADETIAIAQGGTGATTAPGARSALGAAASGSILSSGLTMTSGRYLGRVAGGTGSPEQLTAEQLKTNANIASSGNINLSGLTVASGRIVGRISSGTGNPEQLTPEQAREVVGIQKLRQVVTPGSPFSGHNLICSRVGDQVTITSTGLLTHPSAFQATSANGVIPSDFRPSTDPARSVYFIDGSRIHMVAITPAGAISTSYRDYSGSQSNSTGTGSRLTISFAV